ncbi:MAG: hypothetical protein CMP06_05200 [Xanthomonadales bacterium]|nr:hypothetical protein [Xanthomonadales bacterium]
MHRFLVYVLLSVLLAMPVLQAAEACCMGDEISSASPRLAMHANGSGANAPVPPCHGTAAVDADASNAVTTTLPHGDCAHGAACMTAGAALVHAFVELAAAHRAASLRGHAQPATLDGVRTALIRPPSIT